MSTQMPPQEPLDAQERELARILRALPGGEPPASLDAGILRAAANAAAGSRRPGARLLASAGSMWGIGTAAAAVLALGVAWQMRYAEPDRASAAQSAPRAQAVSDVAEDEAVQVELGEQRKDAPASMPPPPSEIASQSAAAVLQSPRRRQDAAPAVAGAAAPPSAAPEPFALDQIDEHVSREAAANAVASSEAKADSELDKERAASADARDSSAQLAAKSAAAPVASAGGARAELGAASATGGLMAQAAPAGPAPLKPASWLLEVRRLRDEGKITQARARLLEFRRAYPNWVIPTDLAPLLTE